MKKILSSLLLTSVTMMFGQVLESDNYNAYALGNVATATNGTTVGTGNMYVSTGSVTDYQIVAGDATHVKYLQVTGGSDGTTASSRTAFKSNFTTAWNNRTPGNNIIKGTVEIYTGTSTNQHVSGVLIASATSGIVGIRYNSQTKTINGMAYLTPTGGTAAFYNITGLTTSTFPANTWLSLGYTYNKTTGEITYNIGGVSQTLTVNGAATVAGLEPARLQVSSSPTKLVATDPDNTGPTTFGIDNYIVEASNNAVLGTSDIKNTKSSVIAIGPNPASDYLNILTSLKLKNVDIFDITGRKVNTVLNGNQVNIKALNSGTYIINIETEKGLTTEKFIKK